MGYDSWYGNWGFCMNAVHSDHHSGRHQGSVLYPITRFAFFTISHGLSVQNGALVADLAQE